MIRFLLGQDFFQLGKAGQGVLPGQLRLALDQRQEIIQRVYGHVVSLGIYPLRRHCVFY